MRPRADRPGSPTRPPRRRRVGPLLLAGIALAALSACSDDDGDASSAGTGAWCTQFDTFMTAWAEVDGLDLDDPDLDGALATMQDELAALSELEAPAPIAGDLDAISAPPGTDGTGAVETDGPQAAAGGRVAAWALQSCELSPSNRDLLAAQGEG